MRTSLAWNDFEIVDASGGERLERWGDYLLIRPDPQIIWQTPKLHPGWKSYHGRYLRSSSGGGNWTESKLPAVWCVGYRGLVFRLKPMGFKHTGLFPEQAVNWDFMIEKITNAARAVKVLNLFAYTGGATLACARAGAEVVHVDASRGMVQWASENAQSSGLRNCPVRYLVDDCMKFAEREIRRGNRYDAIILDPPSYGRGPGGEIWKLEDMIFPFLQNCLQLLSDTPLFVLFNSYTTGLSAAVTSYLLSTVLQKKRGGTVSADEIGLPVKESGLALPCGASAIWEANA